MPCQPTSNDMDTAEQSKSMRLSVDHINDLSKALGREKGSTLHFMQKCEILAGELTDSDLRTLSALMPNLEDLRIEVFVFGDSIGTLSKLRVLHLTRGASRKALVAIFQSCRDLRELSVLGDFNMLPFRRFKKNIKCKLLTELVLPIRLLSSVEITELKHLRNLSLDIPESNAPIYWMKSLSKILKAKRFEVQSLYIDGTNLSRAFDLFKLSLENCDYLTEVILSNCVILHHWSCCLPYSCLVLRFLSCNISNANTLYCYMRNPFLQTLDLMDCQLPGDNILSEILHRRKVLPVLKRLSLRFMNMPTLKAEYESWCPTYCESIQDCWLHVIELKEIDKSIQRPASTIKLSFDLSHKHIPSELCTSSKEMCFDFFTASPHCTD